MTPSPYGGTYYHQPSFDLPVLKGTTPLTGPTGETKRASSSCRDGVRMYQLWSLSRILPGGNNSDQEQPNKIVLMVVMSFRNYQIRIFFLVVNEACRVYAEGIAVKAADLDIAGVMGMGFPPYRGGVMFWGDSVGSKYIYMRG
ncbi:putative isomerase, 3-hydroxyacyl-CoA dehydrogenase, Enoyl-CoA hydratase [Helianthus annuus]|uniref:Isomerase, 3-hydroxyacyl-CoA dehydrogenase, Enoyl-CoA hydratase n=2 Tax=Helianthus annuus TaxID=4232 RepID=A0A251SMQ3_HELAN|nr:putative isomerase, 3-hydroxyacyl-CoA dehydrogenase, Enoyl-CoA hydratase [Helianthus annuus]